MVPVICVIGWSDSGKTTLVEGLLRVFRGRGLRVGTVKHHPHGEPFPSGKDTTRHLEAGAEGSLLVTPKGFLLGGKTRGEPPLEDLVARYFGGCDLVLAEGFKRAPFPKVEVHREGEGFLYREVEGVIALVTDARLEAPLPLFRADEVEGLADFLQDRYLPSEAGVSLAADGRAVRLNPFVQRLFSGLIGAMVRSLKGCEGAKEAIIHWRGG